MNASNLWTIEIVQGQSGTFKYSYTQQFDVVGLEFEDQDKNVDDQLVNNTRIEHKIEIEK